MIKFIDMTGKTEDEAIRRALEQLGLERDDVSVEILERAKSGFLGIGGSPATVRVSYDDGQPEPVKPEPKSAANFADVPASAYYAKAVAWAQRHGITDGVSQFRFAPEHDCTRAQIVAFLYRAFAE